MNKVRSTTLTLVLSGLLGGALARAAELVLDDLSGGAAAWSPQAALAPRPGAPQAQALRWAVDEVPRLGRAVSVTGSGWRTFALRLFSERMTGGPATRSGGDRNQIVLEAYGERLLLDPGICGYAEARRVVRTMAFVRPDYVVVSDVAEAAQPAQIALNLNFGAPVRLEDDGRTVLAEGPRGRLRVVLLAPATVEAKQHTLRTDMAAVRDHHLALSPPGKVAATQFVSLLLPSPSRRPENARAVRLASSAGYAASVTTDGRQDLILVAAAGATESIQAAGAAAQARLAVVSREAGRLRAVALLHGTRLEAADSVSVSASAATTLAACVSWPTASRCHAAPICAGNGWPTTVACA